MTDIVNGILVQNDQILMAHRAQSRKNYPGTWSFPGGHVEAGEILSKALVRELVEEVGVIAQSWTLFHHFVDRASVASDPVTFHFFKVDQWTGNPTNIGDEHTEIRWVSIDDAISMKDLTFPEYTDVFRLMKAT